MNHAVCALNVCLDNSRCSVELDAVGCANFDVRTVYGRGFLAVHFHDVSSHHFSGHHVVRQNGGQLWNVCQQGFHGAGRQFGKRLVSWGKYSERTRTF